MVRVSRHERASGVEARNRILLAVRSNPGLHSKSISKLTGLTTTVMLWHLRVLVAHTRLVRHQDTRMVRFFLIGFPKELRVPVSVARRAERTPSFKLVLQSLMEGPKRMVELERSTGIGRTRIAPLLDYLVRVGALRREDVRYVLVDVESMRRAFELLAGEGGLAAREG